MSNPLGGTPATQRAAHHLIRCPIANVERIEPTIAAFEQKSALREARPFCVEQTLQRAADKAAQRRFTGGPITGFGELA